LLLPCSCCRLAFAVVLLLLFFGPPGTDPDPDPSVIKQKY
jgi:hypothetical protein